MKKWLTSLGVGIAIATSTAASANTGIVNMSEVFQKMPGREAAEKNLETEFSGRIAELTKLENELKADLQKLQNTKLKATEREKLEKSIAPKREEFAKKAEAFEQDNRRRQNEERAKLLTKIQDVVTEVAKKEKYTLIVDSATIIYADPATDITAKVLEKVK